MVKGNATTSASLNAGAWHVGSVGLAFALLLSCTLGCNLALDLEKGRLQKSDAPECVGAACPVVCEKDADCSAGERCVEDACRVDVEPDPGPAGEGGVDRDGGDHAPDASSLCAEGSLRCDAAGDVLRSVCRDGAWETASPCEGGELCDAQSEPLGQCQPAVPECLGRAPHDAFCEGSERVVCGGDLVTVQRTACDSSAHCREGRGDRCATCLQDAFKCNGDVLARCDAEGQGFEHVEDCNPGECNEHLGRCTALLCEPDKYSCVSNVLHLCNGDGTAYAESKECGTGLCDAAHGECDLCEPGTVQGCANKTTQTVCSSDGQRIEERTCASQDATKPACSGSNGVCTACEPLTHVCQSATVLLSCSAQGTSSTSTCASNRTCLSDRCAGECGPGQNRCSGAASASRQTCGPAGTYVAATACAAGTLCNRAASTAGECAPIVTGCAGKNPNDPVCNGNQRVVCGPDLVTATSSETCKSAAHCQQGSGTECAECLTGEYACSGAQLQICNATHTGFVNHGPPCTSAALCNRETGACTTATCTPGGWSCSATHVLRRCNADGTEYVVSDNQQCQAGLCDWQNQQCDTCAAHSVVGCWSGNSQAVCNSTGQGTFTRACPSGAAICHDGACVTCSPGATRCDPGSPLRFRQTCAASGTWPASAPGRQDCFNSNQTCMYNSATGVSACGGQCAAGEPQCNPTTKNPNVCTNVGAWQQTNICDAPIQICRITNSVASCQANESFFLGNSSFSASDSWQNWLVDNDWSYFIPITSSVNARLEYFRVRGRVANSATCAMALYEDSSGVPGTLRAKSWTNLEVTAGISSVVPDSSYLLQSGRTYWLGASCYLHGSGAELYQRTLSGARSFRFFNPSGTFPNNPVGDPRTGTTYPFFISVLEIP